MHDELIIERAPAVMRRLDADVCIQNGWSLDDCHPPQRVEVERDPEEFDHHMNDYLDEARQLEDSFREMGERWEGFQ